VYWLSSAIFNFHYYLIIVDEQGLKFDLVNKINQQISYELRASYFYQAYVSTVYLYKYNVI